MQFIGNSGAAETTGRTFTFRGDGGNSESIPYEMDASEVSGFLSQWQIGNSHPTRSELYLESITGNYEQADSAVGKVTAILNFTGREEANLSSGGVTVVGRTLVARSASVEKDGTVYTLEYFSPQARVSSFTSIDQFEPNNESAAGLDAAEITIASVVPGKLEPDDFEEDTDYELVTVADGFQTIPLGPSRWRNEETWTRVIKKKSP